MGEKFDGKHAYASVDLALGSTGDFLDLQKLRNRHIGLRGTKMKIALLSLALLGQPVTIPVSDKIPVLNVEASCKATTETDKAMGLTEAQSFSGCMDDEKDAQQKLSIMWADSPSDARNQCERTATTGGSQSYVELLTCLQAAYIVAHPDWHPGMPLRGASKDRNKH